MISPRVYDVCPVPPLLYGTVPNLSLLSVPELTLLALSDDNPEPLPVCVPEKVPPVIVPDKVGFVLMTIFPVPVFVDNLSLLSVPVLTLLALSDDNPEPLPS